MWACKVTSSFLLHQEICTMLWWAYPYKFSWNYLSNSLSCTKYKFKFKYSSLSIPFRTWNQNKELFFIFLKKSKFWVDEIYFPYHQVGHRAYLNLKTIRPNMALFGQLFLNKSMEWPEFQRAVLDGHKNRQGQIRLRKDKQSIYTYPAPHCMCPA